VALAQSAVYPVNLPVAAIGIACHRRVLRLRLATGLFILYLWDIPKANKCGAHVRGVRFAGIWQVPDASGERPTPSRCR